MVSRIADVVRAEIAKGDLGEDEFELDFSMIGYDLIFQDIVRRSPDLDHVQIIAAWTCTKMRPDGFGAVSYTHLDVYKRQALLPFPASSKRRTMTSRRKKTAMPKTRTGSSCIRSTSSGPCRRWSTRVAPPKTLPRIS